VRVVTPADPAARGAQLSIAVPGGRRTFDELLRLGVACDWREPEVLRMAPVPLYNSFSEALEAVSQLELAIQRAGG
jgi:kynureninase